MILKKWLHVICCPKCGGSLKFQKDNLLCQRCGIHYPVIQGVPVLIDQSNLLHKQLAAQRKYFDIEWSVVKLDLEQWQISYIRRIFNVFNLNNRQLNGTGVLLDIGSGGSGYLAIAAAEKGYLSIGCDLSLEGMLNAYRLSTLKGLEDMTLWIVCNAENLPVKDSVISYVGANAVLEHLVKDTHCIQEIDRVTKKGAKCFITVPISYRYIWPFFWLLNYLHDKRIGHLSRYNLYTLKKKFDSTSFVIQKVFYTGNIIKVSLFILSKLLNWKYLDMIAEKFDKITVKFPYGSSNISVYLKK